MTKIRNFALVCGVILFYATLSACARLGDCKSNPTASGSLEERTKWGEQTFGESFDLASIWIRKNSLIYADVGRVMNVAPIGSPNCYDDYFTDGRFHTFTLEVVGEKGRGILRKPSGGIWKRADGSISFGARLEWEHNNSKKLLHDSGMLQEQWDSPENQVKVIDQRMTWGPQQRNHYNYFSRAENYAKLGQYDKAIEDQLKALEVFSNERVNYNSRPAQPRIEITELKNDFLRPLTALSYYQELSGRPQDALATIDSIIADGRYGEYNHQCSAFPALNPWHLRRYLLARKIGRNDASQDLKNRIAEAGRKGQTCWIPYARWLLGELGDTEIQATIPRSSACRSPTDEHMTFYIPLRAYYNYFLMLSRRSLKGVDLQELRLRKHSFGDFDLEQLVRFYGASTN